MIGAVRIYLATANPDKLREFQALAQGAGLRAELLPASAAGGMPGVAEDTGTFAGNARKKALALRERLPPGSWSLADDSGLCVDALGGAPGVESASFAGPGADGAANLAKLLRVMAGTPPERRGIHFVCVLFLAGPDGSERLFEGRCDGRLAEAPRGAAGFGYDPVFIPEGHDRTFAELGDAAKNPLSHRGRAWAQLVAWTLAAGRV